MAKIIYVDPYLSYEVTFIIKKNYSANDIDFGVRGYDIYGNSINLLKVNDQTVESNYFFQHKDLNQANIYYFVRGIVYGYTQPQLTDDQAKLNIGFGNNLFFKRNVRVIEPYLVVNNTGGTTSGSVYIYDLKVRPILTPFSRCFLNKRNNIIMFSKNNNSELKSDKLIDSIRKDLIPYNSSILNIWLP